MLSGGNRLLPQAVPGKASQRGNKNRKKISPFEVQAEKSSGEKKERGEAGRGKRFAVYIKTYARSMQERAVEGAQQRIADLAAE